MLTQNFHNWNYKIIIQDYILDKLLENNQN